MTAACYRSTAVTRTIMALALLVENTLVMGQGESNEILRQGPCDTGMNYCVKV